MIPEERFSTAPIKGQLYNPWSRTARISYHWGPIAIQDPSQGLGVQLWTVRADGADLVLSAASTPAFVWYGHANDIAEVSLAFDQNGRPVVAFVDEAGDAFLRWFDPVPNAIVNMDLSAIGAITPRVTLDDNRPFNSATSDVILAYVREGVVRYRQQRERFTVERTPTTGAGGPVASAGALRHVSMNQSLRLEFLTDEGGGDEDWTLPEVIADLCHRVGLAPERVGLTILDWQKIVRGYTIAQAYQCSGILQALSAVFLFDPASANGTVSFVPRGRDAAATIYDDDLIDDGSDAEIADSSTRRQDSIGVPRVLHLNYYDVAGGLNTDKQRSERPEGTRADGEQSLQTSVVLSADEAASLVRITHGLMVEQQKGELVFSLPDNWLHLTESDAVFIEANGKMVRAILTRAELEPGQQNYRAIRDRQSLYTTQVQGIPAAPVNRPPSSIAGPTLIEFIDIAIQRDTHDRLGFYIGVTGLLPAWPGATVEVSLDGGASYIDGESTRVGSVMGELLTTLGNHPPEYPDEVNSCQVQITTPNALLENTDLVGLLNRRNRALVGDEQVSFADADELSPGVWEVSYWLRGRKGTAAVAHAAGERFVLLDTVMFVPADLAWLNRTLTFRALTFGRPVDEATIIGVTFVGRSQTERQPAYLQGYRSGGDVVLSWQGVGRLGAGATVAMGTFFAGFRLTLTDGTTTQVIDTVANTYTGSLAAFSGPVTARVQQRNQLTGLGPFIEITL